MRDYIILNGTSSLTITGLLIQTLPPISKPRQRVDIEEINGRDGDIVTYLGYGAYDKEFTIGLYGSYDIDEIINYFNSQGIVTFSNEPDKYYNYRIVEQIDFDKLLRYKEATIKMHVQPFKYSAEDNKKIFPITNESSIVIRNVGNIYSRPVIVITGTGTINLSLNGNQLFVINMGSYESITIDTNNMNAYNGITLLNRNVTGNYDNFKLNVGKNTISWTGTITQIEIDNYSRWI
jgi:phage-related protein